MAKCPEVVIWNPIPPESKFCAETSAVTAAGKPSNDYKSSIHFVQPGGTAVDFAKKDLAPGPATLAPLKKGGYGATAKLLSGPSGPTVTLHAWIETTSGEKPFECTWTNSDAGTEFHVAIALVVKKP